MDSIARAAQIPSHPAPITMYFVVIEWKDPRCSRLTSEDGQTVPLSNRESHSLKRRRNEIHNPIQKSGSEHRQKYLTGSRWTDSTNPKSSACCNGNVGGRKRRTR
jgi:hypothetical protein